MKLSSIWPLPKGYTQPVAAEPAHITARPLAKQPMLLPEALPECEEFEEKLTREIIRLEAQILTTESQRHDETWGHRARAALKHMKRDRQRLQMHMKTIRLRERRKDPIWSSFDQVLIRILGEHIPGGLMDECRAQARVEVDRMRAELAAEENSK